MTELIEITRRMQGGIQLIGIATVLIGIYVIAFVMFVLLRGRR